MVKPLYHLTIDVGGIVPSLALSILFLVLAFFYLQKLKIGEKALIAKAVKVLPLNFTNVKVDGNVR